MDIKERIKLRRNIKPNFFTGESVADSIIEEMLESAHWAPTHGYTEPARFVVFSGESRNKFADFHSNLYQEKTSPEAFQQMKFDKLKAVPLLASHIIAIIAKKGLNNRIPFLEEIVSTSCSVQNMLLVAAQNELAVHWTTGGMTYTDEMKTYLGFGAENQVIGFLYLGRSEKVNTEGRRLSNSQNHVEWRK